MFLYKISFPVELTKKSYIGITSKTPSERLKGHLKLKDKYLISKAIKKYGKETIILTTIGEYPDWASLCKAEQDAIKSHNTKIPYGYNCTDGGEGAFGLSFSEGAKLKMSKSRKGKLVSDNTKEKLSKALKNRKFTDDWCKKISEAKKGKSVSEETKKKMSESQLKRMPKSEQARINQSIATKKSHAEKPRQKRSDESIKRQSEKMKAILKANPRPKISEETRKKLSDAARNRVFSDEQKAKMSSSRKGKKYNKSISSGNI